MYLTALAATLTGLQAAPIQAVWPASTPPQVEIRLTTPGTRTISFRDGGVRAVVTIVPVTDGVRISPGIVYTRGVSLAVETLGGAAVKPAIPPAGSPPAAPVMDAAGLAPLRAAEPLVVRFEEAVRTIFPGPGRYRVRAVLSLYDWPHQPVRHQTFASDPVTFTVTP